MSGEICQELGVDGAEEPLDLPAALRASDGGVDQPDVQIYGGGGELVADEVAAVVDVEHVGDAAHRPGEVGLVPDRLPQRQGRVHR